jgi:DNA polymerase III alpha subunit
MDSAVVKMNEITNELYQKTGVSIIIHGKANLAGKNIIEYEKNISSTLGKSFVLVTIADAEHKVDVVVSPDLADKVDRNNILNGYIIPILSAEDKNTQSSRYSAALLNGVAEIADEIAKKDGVILLSSIGNESKDTTNIIRFIIYGITGILVVGLIYRRFSW